jgi:NAD(P)-dependent dehydrogenase (short-subunit alcohol dehydrogenase family)
MVSKSANESMCRSWSAAFGGRNEQFAFMAGTTANAVMAGLTRTGAVYDNNIPEDVIKSFEDEFVTPQDIPRVGLPEDVADVVGLLCREESRWITGSVVSADGGGISIL